MVGQPPNKSLLNKKINRLTILRDSGKRRCGHCIVYICECECGNIIEAASAEIRRGKIKSCGCLLRDYYKTIKGSNHPNYNPNLTDEERLLSKNKRFDRDEKLRDWILHIFKKDDFTCKKCGDKKDIQAHHIMPWAKHIDLRYDINNGITLCKICHRKFHHIYGNNCDKGDILEYINE